ncbi:MAG: hypothetical protein ACOCYE_04400 [Pseudomonadota bacterium]
MTPSRLAEQRVERWLRGLGLAPERFDVRRRRQGKTPDFRVHDGDGGLFLVEVKGLANPTAGHGAIALKLIRAKAQFDAVNQGGRLANVVALVAPDPPHLARVLVDYATLERSPLRGLDLVVGLLDDGEPAIRVLHRAAASRHAAYLARILHLGEAT